MTTARTKFITDTSDCPTNPANETEARQVVEDVIAEVFDNLNTGKAEQTDFVTHKTSSDHDGRYYTETEVNALLTAITVAGLSPDSITDTYLKQTGNNVLPNFNTHLADYTRNIGFSNTSGTSTAFTMTLIPVPGSYATGMKITIIPHVASGANPTININGLGAKNLVKRNGGTIGSGDLFQFSPYTFTFNGTNFVEDSPRDYTLDYVRTAGYAVATGSANTYAITLSPAPTSYLDGMCVAIKINVANTGTSTININGLGAKTLKDANGNDFVSGVLKLNKIYTFRYESTSGNFIIQSSGGGTATENDITLGLTATVNNGFVTGTGVNAKRVASGTITSSSGTLSFTIAGGGNAAINYITVTGLTFQPSKITIRNVGTDFSEFDTNAYKASGQILKGLIGGTTTAYTLDGTNAYVNSTSFRMPVTNASTSYEWEAWE